MESPQPGPVEAAALDLAAALRHVEGLRVYEDPGATVDPPGAVVGPPTLTWAAYCPTPTGAQFPVFLVVALDDRAMARLWALTAEAGEAIDEHSSGVVTRAQPTLFGSGGTDLPAYLLTVETEV